MSDPNHKVSHPINGTAFKGLGLGRVDPSAQDDRQKLLDVLRAVPTQGEKASCSNAGA